MANLYQCTQCHCPFVAEDDAAIAKRGGRCMICTKADLLAQFGLPPDFLIRSFGLGA